jgi:tripartite motif-containing protein 71
MNYTFVTKWDNDFKKPTDVAVDPSGSFSGKFVYVVDSRNDRIQKFYSNGFDDMARPLKMWGSPGSGPGQFNNPNGIAVDSLGMVYVSDTDNNRIQKFDSNGKFIINWGSALT